MIDKNTDVFKVVNNFIKTQHIESIQISKSSLSFTPKVTIAIPTFKRAYLLKEALDSAIAQKDYEDYDIIIVDNNYERNCDTESLIMSYNNKRVSYYKNSENLGMAGNWNRLFELATGEYVVMLHDDDLLLPNFLHDGMEIINRNSQIHLLKPQFHQFTTESKDIKFEEITQLDCKLHKINTVSFYQGCLIGAPTGIFFKKSAVIEIGGYNQEYYPSLDYCFYVLFSKNYNTYYFNKKLSLYRIAENESLNIKTLTGFIISDYFLIKQILINYGIPKIIAKNYLRKRTSDVINIYKINLNKEFTFDFDTLGIRPINKNIGSIYVLIIRLVFLTLNIVKRDKVYIDINSK